MIVEDPSNGNIFSVQKLQFPIYLEDIAKARDLSKDRESPKKIYKYTESIKISPDNESIIVVGVREVEVISDAAE